MAEEIKKVITVDVSGAVESLEDMREEVESSGYAFKSLGDAKKYIDRLRASLIDLDKDSDEYADTVAEIDTVQGKLNDAMKVTGATLKSAEGSYNALAKQMSELKKRFKETNDEAERQSLAKQIVGINDKLKDMDSSIGNFQRNVGNYEGAFTKGLAGISKKIEMLGNPLATAKNGVMALGKAFKSLIMNPVGAVIMAIVAAITALKKGFSESETASNKLKSAFAAFTPVINGIKNIFTGFANIVGNIAQKAIPALVNALMGAGEWMMKLLNKIGIVSDARLKAYQESIEKQKEMIRETQELTDSEIALVEKRRKFSVNEAKAERDIAELRRKSRDEEKYTAEERQKFLEQAIAKERSINNQKLALAQEEYNIMLQRSKLTDNDAETNNKLAESQANLYRIQKEHSEKEIKLMKELQKVKGEVSNEDQKSSEQQQKDLEQQQKDLEKIESIRNRATLSLLSSSEKDLKILKDRYEEEKKLFEEYGEDTVALTEEYNRAVAKLKVGQGEDQLKAIDEEYNHRKQMAELTIKDEKEKNQKLYDLGLARLEAQQKVIEGLMLMENLSLEQQEAYKKKLEEIIAMMDKIRDKKNESEDDDEKNTEEEIKKYARVADAFGNMVSDIAGYLQDSIKARIAAGKISEEQGKKEFENTKKYQIAGAIITGLAGVATAISGAFTEKAGPWDFVLAGIQAASIATSTAIQVAKIRETTLDGSSGGSSSSLATPSSQAVEYTPKYSTNVTGESETVNLANAIGDKQNAQRVYVVESDINEVGKRVSVVESESTF